MAILKNVLIIDDRLDEINDIRQNFLRHGYIPVVIEPTEAEYISFIPDIICCDINLMGSNKDQNFKIIAGILKKIVSHNKLYVFIAWTNNANLFTELKEHLSNDSGIIQPIKYDCFSKETFSVSIFEKMLNRIYDENKGLMSLYDWNNIVTNSLEKLPYNIYQLAKNNSCSTQDILFSLGQKTAGEHFLENKTKTVCTFLHLLLEDEVDSTIKLLNDNSDNFDDLKEVTESISVPVEKLNSALLFSKTTSLSLEIGDFIQLNQRYCMKMRHFIQYSTRKQIKKEINDNIKGLKGLDIDKCIWGIINITADCDHSNKKQGIDKFVLACVAKYDCVVHENKVKVNTPSLIMYRFYDKESNEKKVLIINSKYIFGACFKNLESCTKYFRIRKQILASIRQQVYSQNSRIGTISF